MPARPAARLHPRGMTNTSSSSTNSLAAPSLVLAFVAPIAGFVPGFAAHDQIRASGEGGRGLATGGIVVSSVLIGVVLLVGALNAAEILILALKLRGIIPLY